MCKSRKTLNAVIGKYLGTKIKSKELIKWCMKFTNTQKVKR